jgi:hypothetical protein
MNNINKLNGNDIKNCLFAGRATLTLVSSVTDTRYTYKVVKKDNLYFVKLLMNGDQYNYIGYIKHNIFKWSKKSFVSKDSKSFKAFNYLIRNINNDKNLEKLIIYHSGKCCKCGKELTTPDSIKYGLGPICRKSN